MRGKVLIGTSGWHYKHWRGNFYPEDLPVKDWLQFYSSHFDTVELNNSFYHLPLPSSFDNWRKTTPSTFSFAVKGSRFTTHMKKLKDPETSTNKFFEVAERLEKKLGVILFQLPPHWAVDIQRLDEFLAVMPKHRYAFEFRDESWHNNDVYQILDKYKAALCIHDLGGKQSPIEVTGDFTYIRFHGPTKAKYSGSYSKQALTEWARRIRDWERSLRTIYVYFNNDVGACAPQNATELVDLLQR